MLSGARFVSSHQDPRLLRKTLILKLNGGLGTGGGEVEFSSDFFISSISDPLLGTSKHGRAMQGHAS